MIKNVIFDWSGTLSDDIIPIYTAAVKVLEKLGGKKISLQEFRREFELPYMNFFRKYVPNPDKEQADKIFARVFSSSSQPFPKVKDILEFLHKKGIKMAILSSHPEKFLKNEVKDYGFQKYFMDVVGGVHNKIEVINEIIKKNKFIPEETAYVGDMTHDIEAGKKAKVITIAVSWGYQSKEKLSREKPDFLIADLSELKRIVS